MARSASALRLHLVTDLRPTWIDLPRSLYAPPVMLRIGVLGALDASIEASGSVEVPDLGGPRQRSVLALLLVARGQVVSVDRLVEDLWHGEPPPRAIGALQAYVSHLRRVLEPGRAPRTPAAVLVSEPPG